MRTNLLGFSFLCFEALLALYPANINQVEHFSNGNQQFIRRNANQEAKPFNVFHKCSGDKCKKVSQAIDKLTNTLSNIIQVKNQINIDVEYTSYCELLKVCNLTNEQIFATGRPRKYLAIKNKDGLDITYPSPLYKQLSEPTKNDGSKSTNSADIVLIFNSDDKYWFEGDGDIKAGQPDFSLVAAQTLIRGLGVNFSIGKNGNYELSFDPKLENDTKLSTYDTIFTPKYEISSDNSSSDVVTNIKFNRYILDTLMVTTSDGKSINSLLDPYFNFVFPNQKIASNEIVSYLKKSPLNETSQKLEKLLNTPDSLAIKLPSGNSLALETTTIKDKETLYSLYFNESKYLNTKDGLLTPKVTKSEARLPQGKAEDWPTYPFGPLLIETLEYMGYTLKDSYKSSVNSSNSKKDGDKTDSKSGNNSSNIKANLGLLAAITSLYLLS